MAFTLNEIGTYLENLKCEYVLDKELDSLSVDVTDGEEYGFVIIQTFEDGKIFSLEMKSYIDKDHFLSIPKDHPYINLVLPELLYANYQTLFGTWEYSPYNSEIKYTIEFPVEDSTITEEQFKHILSGVTTALEYQAKFKYILEQGCLPQKSEPSPFDNLVNSWLLNIEETEYTDGTYDLSRLYDTPR